MNRVIVGLVAAICFVSVSAYGWSQYASDQGGQNRLGGRPLHPILEAFDRNQDGQLSEDEIAGSVDYLVSFDLNQDGVLSHGELPKPPKRGQRGGCDPRGGQCFDRESLDRESLGRGSLGRGSVDVDSDRRIQEEVDEIQLDDGRVSIENGHVTDPRDGGRPIALIAAALGVEGEVFREAFSDVRPSKDGPPIASRARENKEKLMSVLQPHGVTNERLDEVSNFYRYRPQDGGLWQHRRAKVEAVIEDGKLISVSVIDGGSGYTTAPTVRVPGHENVRLEAKIEFGQDLGSNGKLVSVDLPE